MQVTVFKSINSHIPQYFDVKDVLERIKKGVNKKLIDSIRLEKDEQKKENLKKQLIWICFSGKFKTRNNEDLLQHSGLMCLDFDKFPNISTYQTWRGKLKSDKHTFAMFTSPSGNGLKVLVKIPQCKSNEEHNLRFDSLAKYWEDCKYFDKNVKGVVRVCFESYDPNIFINDYAETYYGIEEAKKVKISNFVDCEILSETLEIFNNLKIWFEKNYNLNKGNRNTNLFYLLSACRDYDISENEAIQLVTNYAKDNAEDFDSIADEIKIICKSAYNIKPSSGKKMVKINFNSEAIPEDDSIITDDFVIDDYEIEDPVIDNIPQKEVIWKTTSNGLKIDFLSLKQFLQKQGFYRYEVNEKDFLFVKVEENTVQEVDIRHIKDFLLRCLEYWGEIDVYNMIAENTKFKKEYINYLDPIVINWNKDTKESGWVYFENVAVKITKDNIEIIKYIDLDGFIWKSQKLNRKFKLLDRNKCIDADFSKFVNNICNNNPKRINSYRSGIGYLLHRYKSKSTVKAVIFNDEIISSEAMGGTGKGLTMQIISTMKNVIVIPGADFNTGKDFAWQRINFDTDVVLIDDIEKNFKFKKLFTFLTDGWPIRKLYQDEIFMSPEDSPKIAVNTNYTVKGDTDSFERRKFELELYPHYSKSHQPIDEFGREFVREWPESEQNKCDNYLLYCLKDFLKDGLLEPEYVNLKLKKLITNTSEDFVSFAEYILKNDTKYNKKDLFKHYKEEHGLGINEYPNQKIFTLWMEYWGRHNDWTFSSRTGNGGIYFVYGTGESEFRLETKYIF